MNQKAINSIGISAILLLALVCLGIYCSRPDNGKGCPKDSKRYFFIGYVVNAPEFKAAGNFYSIGDLQSVDDYRKTIYDVFSPYSRLNINDCIVTGFYEFRDSLEFDRYRNGRPVMMFDSSLLKYQ